ncbi:MAG: bifunctional 23S rRNA (guanine(2069)-N(7))-methyltransferase RlmK/23S rRNA (guanine(2445)-N(2))-methyltransferase RlmL [Planctomycetota bacterium]
MAFDLIATAAFGLEAVVARELKALGYPASIPQPGRVCFSGDAAAIARCNLWLRSAERVVIAVASFEATDFGQLFDGVAAADWSALVPRDAQLPVRGRSHKSQLSSVPACQKIVKKAIVEKLRASHGVVDLPETGPLFGVEVAMLDNTATITLDTTGVGLHKRGYRPMVGVAPLRETLAAGIVQLSYWRSGRPLLDPFCGTGTIAIEAAMLGRRIAPGLRRAFAAESWPTLPADAWPAAREEAQAQALPGLEQRLAATDVDGDALRLARRAAEAAGVAADIHFQQREFGETSSKREHGCLIANPPYGQRVGEGRAVEQLYRSLPGVLRRLPTWSHYILTAWPDFERLLGQRADRRRKLYNGRIACTLFQFHGPKPGEAPRGEHQPLASIEEVASPAAPDKTRGGTDPPTDTREAARPAFGGLRPEATRQAEEFGNRLRKVARHLRRWPTKRGVTCYRLYDRDIPEAPLVVDRYQDERGQVWLHLAEYDRPHDRTPAEHADWLDHLAGVAARVLEAPRQNVFLKHRARQRGAEQYQKVAEDSTRIVVKEDGLRLRVNLSDYIDTGLFLDHRQTRAMVRQEIAAAGGGARVLNLFAYTGAFTVYAAAGGAAETTTVDLSPTYLDWAADNLRLNGLAGDAHRLIQADARAYVVGLPAGELFDLAVIDPPTFSNTKRASAKRPGPTHAGPARPGGGGQIEDWDVQRHATPLLAEVARRLSPGGVIYFSTNSRRFKLDEGALPGLAVREISHKTVPEDFRNKRIHRCWRMTRGI